MSDSLSNISHIVICAEDITPEKLKPLLQSRNDALDYLSVAEVILKEERSPFGDTDQSKLEEATSDLKKAVLGEYDQFGIKVKPPVSLDKMAETRVAFDEVIKTLPYRARDYFRTKLLSKQYDREERLEKSYEAYQQYLREGPRPSKPTKRMEPIIEDPKAWTYQGVGESEKDKAAPVLLPAEETPAARLRKDDTKWPEVKDSPGIERVPSKDTDYWFKLEPAISQLINLPIGKEKHVLGEAAVENILKILDRQPSLEEFSQTALKFLPPYYRRTDLDSRIAQIKEDISSSDEFNTAKLQQALAKLEERLENIHKLHSNLKIIYENWTPEPMKNKSTLVKNISDSYRIVLGDRAITLETAWLSASIRFKSIADACKKFIDLTTEKEVEKMFDVPTLIQLEKEAADDAVQQSEKPKVCDGCSKPMPFDKWFSYCSDCRDECKVCGSVDHSTGNHGLLSKEAADLSSIVKPNTKGPSAEEEKPMVTSIVEWLNASNAQGTEEDIEKIVTTYLNEKAPDYHDENVARVARKTYAEWKASQPIPSEVGQEGKANVGVANADGTGVFVEPNRGNSGVQNEAPTATVRKEASAEVDTCNQCDMGAHERCAKGTCGCGCQQSPKESSLLILARIVKREDGWYVLSEKGKRLGGPYATRTAAKKRLNQVEMFKHMKGATQEEFIMVFNAGDIALLNTRVGALDEGIEVVVTSCSENEVSFTAGDILGITKIANLDKVTISKEASSEMEKYPWDNDGLKFKYNLGDRVRVGAIESDGIDLKGKEGTIRDKVIMAAGDASEQFYLVEFDGCGTATLPEEALSKAGKATREAALNHEEFTKEAVLKPNFDVVQEFLSSYDHPPTVVTTADIEAWMGDPKNNYQFSKKDLKEIVKYLQSAKVEVRVPTKREAPDVLPDEEMAAVEELKKEAKKYKMEQTKPDGSKVTVEKEIAQDLGASFETEDPVAPGTKNKWTAASLNTEATCTQCAGVGSLPCDCMDSALWLSNSCNKCNDEGATPCPACKK